MGPPKARGLPLVWKSEQGAGWEARPARAPAPQRTAPSFDFVSCPQSARISKPFCFFPSFTALIHALPRRQTSSWTGFLRLVFALARARLQSRLPRFPGIAVGASCTREAYPLVLPASAVRQEI